MGFRARLHITPSHGSTLDTSRPDLIRPIRGHLGLSRTGPGPEQAYAFCNIRGTMKRSDPSDDPLLLIRVTRSYIFLPTRSKELRIVMEIPLLQPISMRIILAGTRERCVLVSSFVPIAVIKCTKCVLHVLPVVREPQKGDIFKYWGNLVRRGIIEQVSEVDRLRL